MNTSEERVKYFSSSPHSFKLHKPTYTLALNPNGINQNLNFIRQLISSEISHNLMGTDFETQ